MTGVFRFLLRRTGALGATRNYYHDQHGDVWVSASFSSGARRCDLCGAPMLTGYRRPGWVDLIVCDAHVEVEDA